MKTNQTVWTIIQQIKAGELTLSEAQAMLPVNIFKNVENSFMVQNVESNDPTLWGEALSPRTHKNI
ncbi:MAG: hypothetical protein ACRC6X_01850 [Culicoidibacterales bacterium]